MYRQEDLQKNATVFHIERKEPALFMPMTVPHEKFVSDIAELDILNSICDALHQFAGGETALDFADWAQKNLKWAGFNPTKPVLTDVPLKEIKSDQYAYLLKKVFPALYDDAEFACPQLNPDADPATTDFCVVDCITLWGLIIHLNDQHEWSRERIADWLESLDVDLRMKDVESVEA